LRSPALDPDPQVIPSKLQAVSHGMRLLGASC
jgi:hypothetical protein